MDYIVNTVEEFFGKLNKMQRELADFSQKLDNRSEKIPILLENFEREVFSSLAAPTRGNAVEKAAQKSLDNLKKLVEAWRYKIEADRKGKEFIKKNEKYLVVMIFGAVKAGKSSLGNFFAGKKFLAAPFDNPYKHIDKPIFETEERGRDTGDVEKDAAGNTWFSEGVIDTTGAIQYFTLSGLRWVDSPGTGAVKKAGDTKNMTALVEEYLSYTDMCIFLMNSSEPGLNDDMAYMKKLSKEGQEALIVITKSDKQEEDIDDEGNLSSVTIPKSQENRQMQEEDICKRVKERYSEIDANRFRALSISTLLAGQALEEDNEEKYRASNLDKLMKILGDKVESGAIERKEANPRKLLNGFVDYVLEGLDKFSVDLQGMEEAIDKYKQDMELRGQVIVSNVKRNVKAEVMQKSYEWNSRVKRGDRVDNSIISLSVADILKEKLNAEINAQMRQVIEDYEAKEFSATKANLSAPGLTMKTATITHTYTDSYWEEREPEGIIEHIQGFFGKKFGSMKQRSRTEEQVVDIGTNLDEFITGLMPQVEKYAQEGARQSLRQLRDGYFKKREDFAAHMKQEIEKLKTELKALKIEG